VYLKALMSLFVLASRDGWVNIMYTGLDSPVGSTGPGAESDVITCVIVVQALMSLFVLASRDGWVNIMYTGLDAVGVDQQVGLGLRQLDEKTCLK